MFQHISGNSYFVFQRVARARRLTGEQHYHGYFEIYLLDAGTCSYFIDNKVYQMKSGDLVLIPPGILHKANYTHEANARRLIWCSAQYVPQDVADRLPDMPHFYRNPALLSEITAILEQIEREGTREDGFTEHVLMHYMHLFFYTLVRGSEGCAHAICGNPYIEQAVLYIKAHYDRALPLAEVARHIAVSPEHLSRVFKKETGFGFSEYLTALRLQRAEAMIKENPKRRISAVAFVCGFNDSNYFSEKFKQVYGYSPVQLRARIKQEK